MKKRIVSLVALILVSYGLSANATSWKALGIRGTSHDFAKSFGCFDGVTGAMKSGCTPKVSASNRAEDEICIFCHTPHHSNTAETNAPLWNRAMTATNYTAYNPSADMKATVGQPTGISKLCLSCHDGTVAIDAYGTNVPGAGHTLADLSPGNGPGFGNASANLGVDLTSDHPVSFTYDTALSVADPGVFDPSTKVSHKGDLPANAFATYVNAAGVTLNATIMSVVGSGSTGTIADDMLEGGKVECTSCHEPHNKYGWNKYLVKNNTGSGLCLTCHNK